MSRPRFEHGLSAWEANTLLKSHLDSLFAGYSEPLLGLRLVLQQQQPGLHRAPPVHVVYAWTRLGVGRIALAMPRDAALGSCKFACFESRRGHHYRET